MDLLPETREKKKPSLPIILFHFWWVLNHLDLFPPFLSRGDAHIDIVVPHKCIPKNVEKLSKSTFPIKKLIVKNLEQIYDCSNWTENAISPFSKCIKLLWRMPKVVKVCSPHVSQTPDPFTPPCLVTSFSTWGTFLLLQLPNTTVQPNPTHHSAMSSNVLSSRTSCSMSLLLSWNSCRNHPFIIINSTFKGYLRQEEPLGRDLRVLMSIWLGHMADCP